MRISFLAGMPRTGGTLLGAILSQNPQLYASSNSPLAQILWDVQNSLEISSRIQKNPDLKPKMMSEIPKIVYSGIDTHILDKCATWGLQGNLDIIYKYVTSKPKFLVTIRPLVDIVKSFVFIRSMNGWKNPEYGLLDDNTHPLMVQYGAFANIVSKDSKDFYFVDYDQLVDNPPETINGVYDFMGWNKYEHDYENIINKNKENDDSIELIGLHDIRQKISRRKLDVKLSKKTLEKIEYLDLYHTINRK